MTETQREVKKQRAREQYQRRKAEGVCNYCGHKKPASGKLFCPECLEKQKTRALENYYFYRQHHICTRCKIRESEPKKSMCLECSFELIAKYKPKTKNQKERKKITDKQRYEKLKAEGLCTNCQRKTHRGLTLCVECSIKNNRRQRNKKECPNLDRSERPSYGMCYICAKPVKEGKKLCEKHYAAACKNAEYAATFVDYENHHWRTDNGIIFYKKRDHTETGISIRSKANA